MELACVIVTYNPEPERFERELKALLAEPVDKVIVVDNGSGMQTLERLEQARRHDARIECHYNGHNHGIAAAQNLGIATALAHGCYYVLLLDHDSIPSSGLVTGLLTAARAQVASGERFAAVGARTIDPRSGQEHGFCTMRKGLWRRVHCPSDNGLVHCEFLNASGSLIYLPAWQEIGAFDETFFIDHVETDWYMRARHLHYRVYGLCAGHLDHTMGDDIVRYWWLRWRSMPRRRPERHYTIVRNSLWMYRRPYVPWTWIANNAAKLLFTLIFFSLFDRRHYAQFRSIIRGLRDGMRAPTAVAR